MPKTSISFIVSAYNRPSFLMACLATLGVQTEPHETIVCINSPEHLIAQHIGICRYFRVKYALTGHKAPNAYFSSEMVVKKAIGQYLCFPSDDSLYFPDFSDLMMRTARAGKLDLVYCDMVYDPMRLIQREGRYGILRSRPLVGHIDKTNFLVRREWFAGWPGKKIEGGSPSDGLLIEDIVRRGAKHGKAEGILCVHN